MRTSTRCFSNGEMKRNESYAGWCWHTLDPRDYEGFSCARPNNQERNRMWCVCSTHAPPLAIWSITNIFKHVWGRESPALCCMREQTNVENLLISCSAGSLECICEQGYWKMAEYIGTFIEIDHQNCKISDSFNKMRIWLTLIHGLLLSWFMIKQQYHHLPLKHALSYSCCWRLLNPYWIWDIVDRHI